MEIRIATERDIPGMLELLLQVGQVHHEIRPDIFPTGTQKYDQAALRELLKDSTRPIFVAMEGDFVAGYCFCVHKDYSGTGVSTRRKELYIDDLCVDENRRGQGIAGALYRHVTAYAKAQGCQFITLNVWCGNDGAMRFYENAGLRPRNIMMEMPLEDTQC